MNWDDYTEITTPADGDTALVHDVSETVVGSKMKKITWANIKAALSAIYLTIANKAAGTDLDTGTDDAKYATAKAIKDSHNVPSVAPGTSGNVLTSNGTDWTSAAPSGGGGGASTPPGRLTLESGVPVSTTDQADKTTLYYTPYVGNQIMLYSGSAWETKTFAELSLNISAFTASKPYDIFCYNNSGTATLEGLVWTNATTRATALVYQDGRLVKAGATTRLYLGTIYMDAASKCQDTLLKRYCWNYYNRVNKKLFQQDSTASWTYSTSTWRQARATATNKIEFVSGLADNNIHAFYTTLVEVALSGGGIAIGLDRTDNINSNFANLYSVNACNLSPQAVYDGSLIGFHYLAALEKAGSGTPTFYGAAYYSLGAEVLG